MKDEGLIDAIGTEVKPPLWRKIGGSWYVSHPHAIDFEPAEFIPQSYLKKVDITTATHWMMVVVDLRSLFNCDAWIIKIRPFDTDRTLP